MRIVLALMILFLSGCLDKENVLIEKHKDGKPTGITMHCKHSSWHSECGPTYSECDDGKEHGCGTADNDLWLEGVLE